VYLDTHTHTRTHTHTLFQHANRSWILEGRNPPERQPLRVERAQEEVAEATQRAAEVCPALVASCVGWCWRKVTTQSTTGSKGVSSTCCFLRGLFAGEKSQRKTQRAAKVCLALVASCVGCSLEKSHNAKHNGQQRCVKRLLFPAWVVRWRKLRCRSYPVGC